jgi:hypothetical protein
MSRRQLIGLVAIVAALLIAGTDAWAIHHFSANAATKNYPDDYLTAVACPSAAQCWAVGQTGSAPGGNTLSEARGPLLQHETAGRWHRAATAGLGAKGAALESITCPGAADCWAVGGNSAGGQAVIGHWTGGAWQPAGSPAPHGSQLNSVACASADACWATGGTQSRSGTTADLLEQWDGTRWSIITTVAGGLRPRQFSCPHAGYCLALGVRGGAAAAAAYSGGRWTAVTPPPAPAEQAGQAGQAAGTVPSLFGCASPAMCLAAFPGPAHLVTDVWNGQAWTPVTTSMLTYPVGLTCSGGDGCWLLGMTHKDRPLALHWQSGGWAAVSGPAARHQGYLTALACGSGCWAVGGTGGTRRNGVPYTSPLIEPLS